jgi:hypothetical protein
MELEDARKRKGKREREREREREEAPTQTEGQNKHKPPPPRLNITEAGVNQHSAHSSLPPLTVFPTY